MKRKKLWYRVLQQPQETEEIIIQSKVWDHYQPVSVSLLVIGHTEFPPLSVVDTPTPP